MALARIPHINGVEIESASLYDYKHIEIGEQP